MIEIYEQPPANFSSIVEVSAIYLKVDGKILLLERAHGKLEAKAWGVPAGKIETDETPLRAAQRELYEETGIEISSTQLNPLGQLYIRKPGIDYIYHLFALDLNKRPQIRLSDEHLDYQWVSKREAENLPLMQGAIQTLDYYEKKQKAQRLGTSVNAYLILRDQEKILLAYRQNTGYFDHHYCLVAGHVEEGEPATQAMIREAYEEIGIDLKYESLKAVHVLHRKTNRLNIDLFFECTEWQGTIKNCEPDKCGGVDFFHLKKLPENTVDYIKDALKAIQHNIFYSEIGW